METKTETFFVICKKGDRTKLMKDYPRTGIVHTGDMNEAVTETNPRRLFVMLEEYADRFNNEWEVVKVKQTTTIDHRAMSAAKELELFKAGRY
jgi:hypothetical protein